MIQFKSVCIGFVIIFGVILESKAQIPSFGKCPLIIVQEKFDFKPYTGLWYEVERYPFLFELGKCTTAEYNQLPNGTITVANTEIDFGTNSKSSATGSATIVEPGKLNVQFPKAPPIQGANYVVLGTDYTSYSAVYSCTEVADFANLVNAWILTREKVPSNETLQKAYDVFNKNKVSLKFFIKTEQNDCPK